MERYGAPPPRGREAVKVREKDRGMVHRGRGQVRGLNDQRESRPPNPESDAREGEVRGIFSRMSRAGV